MGTDLKATSLGITASALTGAELIPCAQGGASKALSPDQIKTYALASIGQLNVDNLRLDGNTLSSQDANGTVAIAPNGTGAISLLAPLVQLGGTSAAYPALKAAGNSSVMQLRAADDSGLGIGDASRWRILDGSTVAASLRVDGLSLNVSGVIRFSGDANAENPADTGQQRAAAGAWLDTDGSVGLGRRLTGRVVEASTAGSGAPNVLLATESRKLLTNEGATAEAYNSLPASAPVGTEFVMCCVDTDGIRLVAQSGETIRIDATVSASGGFVRSVAIGSVLVVVKINGTQWLATSKLGTWTIDV